MEKHKPTVVLISCQFIYSGLTLISRAALLQDLSPSIFVFYRQFIAFLLIAPIAFLARRKTERCHMGWKNFWLISLLSLIGATLYQNVAFEGLYLASSSASSAMNNLVPAITFIMAYLMGMEKVNLRNLRSLAKILGTIFCVSGAVSMALLKGPKLLNMGYSPNNLLSQGNDQNTWLLGCFLLFAGASCWALWLILQVCVSASYPDHLLLTTWMCLIASIQSGILALVLHPNIEAWKLNTPLSVTCCVYAGFTSAVTFFAQAWCVSKRGPVFAALFNPLCTVIVTVVASSFMHEEMYTGSLMGAIVVVIGLYIVLWGKARDREEIEEDTTENAKLDAKASESCKVDLEAPLLPADKESMT